MEAWGNSSGQPLGIDFDSQARSQQTWVAAEFEFA